MLAASAVAGLTRAQEGPGPDGPDRTRDPIVLAADQVQSWDVGADRWFLLSGQVAVLQGDEGLRARQAVVRVKRADAPGMLGFQAEVYAEGEVRPVGPATRPLRALRMRLQSVQDVQVKPYNELGLSRPDGPPRDAPILRRGFPQQVDRSAAATTTPRQARPGQAPSGYLDRALPPRPVARGRTPDATSLPEALPRPAEQPRPVAPLQPVADATPTIPASSASESGPIASLPPINLPPLPEESSSSEMSRPDPSSPSRMGRSHPEVAIVDDPGTVVRADATGAAAAGGREVTPTQFAPEGDPGDSEVMSQNDLPPTAEGPGMVELSEEEVPPTDASPVVPRLTSPPGAEGPGTTLEPLPGPDGRPLPPISGEAVPPHDPTAPPFVSPILPGTQRITRINPRNVESAETLRAADGTEIMVIRGGIQIVSEAKQYGIIEISADNAIIWRKIDPKKGGVTIGADGERIENAGQPMEVYLEGNVVFLQDERRVAGNGDQKTLRAKQAFYDFRNDRFVGLEAEINMFGPGLIAPARVFAPRIDQFRPLVRTPEGKLELGMEEIRAERTLTTGSRFPDPGYSFTSRSTDIKRVLSKQADPNTGRPVGNPRDPRSPDDLTWRIDSRQNIFWLGPVPTFYYPRFVGNADDLEPPIRALIFRTNNYFGQQVLVDLNGFRLLGIDKPKWIDQWNIDVDVLSNRGVALGTEIGWFGRGLLQDLANPYRKPRPLGIDSGGEYFGYFDIWGLKDSGNDVLGSGPDVITNNNAAANKGFQRSDAPPFQDFRGKITARHMQSFLNPFAEQDEDFRLQVEIGYVSDRNFLEEYYKRIFDTGLDQETLAYLIRQKENRAWSVWAEANLNDWYTDTQWLPRLDYYRLGDSLLGNWFTYSQHSGADFANTHKAAEVNNPFIFAYLPYDPISNTSQDLSAGRFYTTHELDLPLQFDFIRFIPYVQGQAVGWTDQINGEGVGRVWGAAGARASIMAWRAFPGVESEIFNIHGLNHKINLDVDARAAWSNVKLDEIGVQDDLDDNTYEFSRRYFALTNYAGGLLPPQYDPRHLTLRRVLSPISGPTDIQASLETVQFNLHQRLQTKRGPEGRRRVIDYMTLDLSTTYFPYASRDNFGESLGQNMYNWQWFIGDRTSIVSYGWFEFWDIGGKPIFNTNIDRHNNPFGLNVITSGLSISRPPKGNAFLGYTIIDTGPINTSALNASVSYWLSPKWYGSYSTMYDFGNAILLGSQFAFTRVGADYLTTIGLTVDPQRDSYMFAFMLAPRISPSLRLGSAIGLGQFDARYAPTQ